MMSRRLPNVNQVDVFEGVEDAQECHGRDDGEGRGLAAHENEPRLKVL